MFKIERELIEGLLRYLAMRPYQEVATLILQLQQCEIIKPAGKKDANTKDDKPKD